MRKVCLTALVILALPMFSFATVLTFGPLCSGSCSGTPLGSYGGFSWSGDMYAEGNTAYMSSYGNTYGAPSGGAAYNGFGDDGTTVTSATPFFFNGADFTTWAGNDMYQSYSSLTVTIFAFDSSMNFLGGCSQTLSAASYNFLTCDIANVSELVFHNDIGTSGHWWLMDDFTYNGTTTPEPGTLVMFGSGLLAAAGMIRRRLS
jgi:PEP-CTERM motif